MDIDIERLKWDADYWDEKAKEFPAMMHLYYPRPTKPAAPEWDGEGYPPVGTVCEARMIGKAIANKVLVMGYFDDLIWLNLQNWDEDGLYSGSPVTRVAGDLEFRPIRTQADRDRDEIIECIRHLRDTNKPFCDEDIASAIIAAGYRKEK